MCGKFGMCVLGGLVLTAVSAVQAVPVVDVIDASSGQANTYFVPTDAQKYDSPYYRDMNQDWGWTQNGIAGSSFSSATLYISAFDVDFPLGSEVDIITAGGIKLGQLTGASDTWSYATFDLLLAGVTVAQINAGLQVYVDIDSDNTGFWLLTLGKSVLTVDGGTPPPPEPGVQGVPDAGSTMMMLGMALLGLKSAKKFISK